MATSARAPSVPDTGRGRRTTASLGDDRVPAHQVGRAARRPDRQVVPGPRGATSTPTSRPASATPGSAVPGPAGTVAGRWRPVRHDHLPLRLRHRRRVRRRRALGDPVDRRRTSPSIDLTHEIPAYDVRAGSLTLGRAAQYLCPGVVLAVVDPGVGTERRGRRHRGRRRAELPRRPRQRAAGQRGRHVRRGHRRRRAHQPRLPAARPRARRSPGATSSPRPPPTSAPACPSPSSARRSTRSSLLPGLLPLTREEDGARRGRGAVGRPLRQLPAQRRPRRGRRPRRRACSCAGATTSAPPSAHATYEGIDAGQVGLVVDSYGMLSVCLGKRSAAAELRHARRHRGHPAGARRRRHAPAHPVPARHPHPPEPRMRPGTTLVLADPARR